MFLDPVSMADWSTHERHKDIAIHGAFADLGFTRHYTSSDDLWSYSMHIASGGAIADVPKPFGASWSEPHSLRWWHNFFSMAIWGHDGLIMIRQPTGSFAQYLVCSSVPCRNPPKSYGQSERSQLYTVASGSTTTGFIFQTDDGYRWIYDQKLVEQYSVWYFFPSKIVSPEGVTTATIAYDQPMDDSGQTLAGCPQGGSGTMGWTPYIRTITEGTATGNSPVRLTFHYKLLSSVSSVQQCVISSISAANWTAGASAEETLVTYSYQVDQGAERPGLLASATYEDGSVINYDNPLDEFKVSVGGTTVVDHLYDSSNRVEAVSGPFSSYSLRADGGTFSYQDSSIYSSLTRQAYGTVITDNFAGSGDGTQTASPSNYDVFVGSNNDSYHEPRYVEMDGPHPGAMSEWTYPATVDAGVGAEATLLPGHQKALQSALGTWMSFKTELPSNSHLTSGVPSQLLEVKQISFGADDSSGTGALATKRFDYDYHWDGTLPFVRQLRTVHETDSVLSPGQVSQTKLLYSASNRLEGTIRSGFTEIRDPTTGAWSIQQRFIGTFYLTTQACSGSNTPDPYDRVVEIHGPCFVANDSATDCSPTDVYPVTQVDYYGATSDNTSERVQAIRKYSHLAGATACLASSAAAQQTTVLAYDVYGNPTQTIDANGSAWTYTYDSGHHVTSVKLGSDAPTSFAYENGVMTLITYPEGNHEVLCHHLTAGGAAGCDPSAPWSTRLLWRAKTSASDSMGNTWAEKISYTYLPNGERASASYREGCTSGCTASSGAVFRTEEFDADFAGRETWSQLEGSSGATVKAFGATGNVLGRGAPFNNAPAFCGGVSAEAVVDPSHLCQAFQYDALSRLTSGDQYFDASSGMRTCFSYDTAGNVRSIATGCAAGADCSTCSSPASGYEVDDFGNVTAVTQPWLDDGSGSPGTIRYQFDARNNQIVKETPAMRANGEYLSASFDLVGRPLSLVDISTSNPTGEQLWALAYDSPGVSGVTDSLPAGCSANNTVGRLLYQDDSFGRTWFSYDGYGRLVRESRIRGTASTCGGDPNDNPDTTYTYTLNGRLATIDYPFGRKVIYAFGSNGLEDRAASIFISHFDGTVWSPPVAAITKIDWNPYSGLHGYEIEGANGPVAVEYSFDEAAETSGTACPATLPTGGSDGSGRTTRIWVSTGAYSRGGGSGDLLKRRYEWKAGQVVEADSCFGGSSNPQVETLSYDRALRLTEADNSAFATAGGAYGQRIFTYDARGNRSGETREDCAFSPSFDLSHGDWLLSQASTCTDALLRYDYSYDSDGRVVSKLGPLDYTSQPSSSLVFAPGAGQSGTDSVYRSVTVNGGTYQYFYDASNHRRLKEYPTGASDEYFRDSAGQLLVDRGNDSAVSPSSHPYDDYIWLAGRLVVIVRGELDSSFQGLSDTSASCSRNGDSSACGTYFPVLDVIGAPILMINEAGKIVGTGEYQPFGAVNRVSHDAESPHPYGSAIGTSPALLVAAIQQPSQGNLVSDVRLNIAQFDVVAGSVAWQCSPNGQLGVPWSDLIQLTDATSGNVLYSLAGGELGRFPHFSGSVTTPWVHSGGALNVSIVAGCNKRYNESTGACECAPISRGDQNGLIVDSYEYRRHDSTATPFWVPLRRPGQYYDEETGLLENWSRFYDSRIGRYLESEPMLHSPEYVKMMVLQGRSVPAYAYAFNNPLANIDPTGRQACTAGMSCRGCFFTPSGEVACGPEAAEKVIAAMLAAALSQAASCDGSEDQIEDCGASLKSCGTCCKEKVGGAAPSQHVECVKECTSAYSACMKGQTPTNARCWPGTGVHNR